MKGSRGRIQDSGFRIQDSGFRIQDSGFRNKVIVFESNSNSILNF